ncbi:GTP-binding protein RHO3 [Paraphaeosphaeria sporulosa]
MWSRPGSEKRGVQKKTGTFAGLCSIHDVKIADVWFSGKTLWRIFFRQMAPARPGRLMLMAWDVAEYQSRYAVSAFSPGRSRAGGSLDGWHRWRGVACPWWRGERLARSNASQSASLSIPSRLRLQPSLWSASPLPSTSLTALLRSLASVRRSLSSPAPRRTHQTLVLRPRKRSSPRQPIANRSPPLTLGLRDAALWWNKVCAAQASAPARLTASFSGDGACGKTSLLNVFTRGYFPTVYEPTVFENYVHDIYIDNTHVELSLWDTAGQEEFDRLRSLSYDDTHAIMLCFSVDSPDSLENVETKWVSEIAENCPGVKLVLVALKCDLRKKDDDDEGAQPEKALIQYDEGLKVAERIKALRYLECSAMKNRGVNEAFTEAARVALSVKTNKDQSSSCTVM